MCEDSLRFGAGEDGEFLHRLPHFVASIWRLHVYVQGRLILRVDAVAELQGMLTQVGLELGPEVGSPTRSARFPWAIPGISAARGVPDRSQDADGFLPASALSTLGVVAILARWSSAAPNDGSLREAASRASAEGILCGLSDACLVGPRSLHIVFASSAVVNWPAPLRRRPPSCP